MNVGQKILAVVIITVAALVGLAAIVALLCVGHAVGGLILVWLVGLATAGAVQLTFLQGFAISWLFAILVASLQAITHAARGR